MPCDMVSDACNAVAVQWQLCLQRTDEQSQQLQHDRKQTTPTS
jgi:hypothetical protein